MFGLLIFGLVLGVRHWRQGVGNPGLPVNLFLGKANILLLTVALFVASEQAQGRQGFRFKRDFAGGLFVDREGVPARIVRQEPKPSGGIEVGLQFDELNEHTR